MKLSPRSFGLACIVLMIGMGNCFQPTSSSSTSHLLSTQTLLNLAAFHNKQALTSSQLHMSDATTNSDETMPVNESSTENADGSIDVASLGKYVLALGTQMTLIKAFFTLLDKLLSLVNINKNVHFGLNILFFYFLALKSRIFNPLSNQRPLPNTKEINGEEQRKMPTWTPPGFVFPIVWLLLIGPLRAVTSSIIYNTTQSYSNPTILSLMLHLSIGDVWNTINNEERRYGTSVLFMSMVWSSAAFAAFQYYKVVPIVGKLLSLKLIWLSVASSLIVRTWQLNPNTATNKKYSLLPRVGEGLQSKLVWFSNKQK